LATSAGAAGLIAFRLFAKEKLAEKTGGGGFSDTIRAGENQAMWQSIGAVCPPQLIDRDRLFEDFGPVFHLVWLPVG
jgi:hypothetical protein